MVEIGHSQGFGGFYISDFQSVLYEQASKTPARILGRGISAPVPIQPKFFHFDLFLYWTEV